MITGGKDSGIADIPGERASGMSRLQSRAWRIAIAYAVFATLWIYFSDRALQILIPDPEQFLRWSVYKGVTFVALTTIMLLLLMLRAFGAIESGYARLKAHKAEIERFNRLYSALSQINHSIVWSTSHTELFGRVCEALVEQGGFNMAWIGWQDAGARRLAPVAAYGAGSERAGEIVVWIDDRAEGHGQTSRVFRDGRPYICNDMVSGSSVPQWRELAVGNRLHSYAIIPIRENGRVSGLMHVFSDTPDYFQQREIQLLVDAAQDVSFALDNFLREQERREAEATAMRESAFSRAMIDSMPGILYFYNEHGEFLRWNRNFEKVSGYSAEEIAQMHPLGFFATEDQRALEERIGEVFRSGESSVEAPFLTKNGNRLPYYFTGRKIEFDGMSCLVGVGIDISERVRAETALRDSEQRYRRTLDNMLEGCQLIGHDWRYLYLNREAESHGRRPNQELLGRTMMECWPGFEQTQVFAVLKRCMKERVVLHEETEFAYPDGGRAWFEIRCQPVPEGIFVLSVEITERKQAEMALRELNETLELRVLERTRELEAAMVRAEAADRIKSAFLATMSHELRTPLNSIIGFTGIVLQGHAGPLTPEQKKQLGMVQGSARHLLDLINDVLDLSKIEAGQLEIRVASFDLGESMERVLASVTPFADKKQIALVNRIPAEGLPVMSGDRRRIEQILLNLLNNAIKFTDHGTVTLGYEQIPAYRIRNTDLTAPALAISVTDTGIGIRTEDLQALFQPFRQLDSGLARMHEGTGLGLTICRRLAELMGGEIMVSSEWGTGSRFTAMIPLQTGNSTHD